MNEFKEELKSAGITFLVAFFMVIYSQIDSIKVSSLEDGTLIALSAAAVRAGFKALIGLFITIFQKGDNTLSK